MTAQIRKPKRKSRQTPKQQSILKTIADHPDLSTREVARLNDTTHSYVVALRQEYNIHQEELKLYKDHRSDIFANVGKRIINQLTDESIKRMMEKAPGAAALWFNSVYNNERLERNLSTDNIHVHNDIIEHKRLIRASREPGGTGQKLKE